MKKSKYYQEGTPFQKAVWAELVKIPRGHVTTYAAIAKNIGRPRAIRAVANAVASNKLLVTVPCHRVIRSDGKLGGYSGPGGIKQKRDLLKKEGVDNRLALFLFDFVLI